MTPCTPTYYGQPEKQAICSLQQKAKGIKPNVALKRSHIKD